MSNTIKTKITENVWGVYCDGKYVNQDGELFDLAWHNLNELCETKDEAESRAEHWKYAHDDLKVVPVLFYSLLIAEVD